MPEITPTTIAENAAKPQSAAGDGESVAQVPIQDQIAADRYNKGQDVQASGTWPIRFGVAKPPGMQE